MLPLICAAGAGGWWWWSSSRAKENALDYKTAAISRGDIVQSVTANGQINPVKEVQVGSQISGIIKEIFADFNSQVTNGQVITQIDPSTYQQVIVQSEAELANAQAGLELAQVTYDRNQALRTNELISKSEFDKSRADLHQAEAVVKTREALLRKANVDLERTTIYAPIDGVVISRNVDVGQTVAANFNTPTLFLIANDLRKMQIEAMVSEADVGGVEVAQRVNFTVDAFPSRQFQGQVKQVRYAPITNQNVVNYTAIVEVDNSDLKLRPGMTANATVVTARQSAALRIPNAALRFRPPENAVVKGATNAAARASALAGGPGSTNRAARGAALADSNAPALPVGDQMGGGMASREERRRMLENMTPEQREQFRATMRARFGDGPPRGFGSFGGGGRSSQEGPATVSVYVLDKSDPASQNKPALKAITVKTGITDGTYTEVLEGLKEGDVVVTGVNAPTAVATAARPASASPFGGPFGMRPPR
jgi:HlyD family secretion protein